MLNKKGFDGIHCNDKFESSEYTLILKILNELEVRLNELEPDSFKVIIDISTGDKKLNKVNSDKRGVYQPVRDEDLY